MANSIHLLKENTYDIRENGPVQHYTVGTNCRDIRQDDHGRWWVDVDTHNSFHVPDHMIGCVHFVRTTAVSDATPSLPAYAERVNDGFKCKHCSRVLPTLQGLKIHVGKEHQE